MATYLFAWNPKKWDWSDIEDDVLKINQNGFCDGNWTTGVNKSVQIGDRFFLMRLGLKPKGIMGSGIVTSNVYQSDHWIYDYKLSLYVKVRFDVILNPNFEKILEIDVLENNIDANILWTPQASGMRIPDDVAEKLENMWENFLDDPYPERDIDYPDEVDESLFLVDQPKKIMVNKYERDPKARAQCIKKYKAICAVCDFNFREKYGRIGAGYIHVHHLIPLSKIHEGYSLNPIEDLRPVCPNCHAMLHQRKPNPFSIEELKTIINRTK